MKVSVSFTVPDDRDPDQLSRDVMAIEEALPDDADDFEWDSEDE